MLNHPAQRVSDYEIGEIFGAAYLRTAVADKAITGFRAAGICPFNPNVFTDEDFSASLVTERSYDDTLPTVSDHVPTPSRSDRAPSTSGSVAATKKPVRTRAAESRSDRAPSASGSMASTSKHPRMRCKSNVAGGRLFGFRHSATSQLVQREIRKPNWHSASKLDSLQ
jgi:hypothetical protein